MSFEETNPLMSSDGKDPGMIKLPEFIPEEPLKQVSNFIIDSLCSESFTKLISTENQILFVFPILTSALNSDDISLVKSSIEVFCNWLLTKCPGENTQIQNKYLRLSLNYLKKFFDKLNSEKDDEKAIKIKEISKELEKIGNALTITVMNPPCEYDRSTWTFLMQILPKISIENDSSEYSRKIMDLSMYIFVTSGLYDEETKEILLSRSNKTKSWKMFIGDIIVSLVIPNHYKPSYYTAGKWNPSNPATPEFIKQILDVLLLNNNDEIRSISFFGVISTVVHSKCGIVNFEYPIEDILRPYADVAFPLEKIGAENYALFFDFFALGYLPKDSDWYSVLRAAIRIELKRVSPQDALVLICGMSKLIASKPFCCVDLVPDVIAALKATNMECLPKEMEKDWGHLCTSINELYQALHSNQIKELLELFIEKMPSYKGYLQKLLLSFAGSDNNFSIPFTKPKAFLYEAFAPHFSPNLVSKENVEDQIKHVNDYENKEEFLLMLIEIISTSDKFRKDSQFMLNVSSVAENLVRVHPYLAGFLHNLVTVPIQYQLSEEDITKIERESLKIRCSAGIASSAFAPNGSSTVIFRNPYSTSAFKLSLTRSSAVESVEIPPPSNPLGDPYETKQFTPFQHDNFSRPPDTFTTLASLGLFTNKNSNRIEILKDTKLLKKYESMIGPKAIIVSLARVSTKSCKSIFGAKRATPLFNEFMKKIGNFRNIRIGENKSDFPVPTFDTALFRFQFVSQFHFNNEKRSSVIECLLKQKILVVFSENGMISKQSNLMNYDLIIEFSPLSNDLYRMIVSSSLIKFKLPFNLDQPRLVWSNNLANELGLVLFIYSSMHVNELFVEERTDFIRKSGLFNTENAPHSEVDLMEQVFMKP